LKRQTRHVHFYFLGERFRIPGSVDPILIPRSHRSIDRSIDPWLSVFANVDPRIIPAHCLPLSPMKYAATQLRAPLPVSLAGCARGAGRGAGAGGGRVSARINRHVDGGKIWVTSSLISIRFAGRTPPSPSVRFIDPAAEEE